MAIGLKLVANELCQKYERFFRVEAQYRKRPSVKKRISAGRVLVRGRTVARSESMQEQSWIDVGRREAGTVTKGPVSRRLLYVYTSTVGAWP